MSLKKAQKGIWCSHLHLVCGWQTDPQTDPYTVIPLQVSIPYGVHVCGVIPEYDYNCILQDSTWSEPVVETKSLHGVCVTSKIPKSEEQICVIWSFGQWDGLLGSVWMWEVHLNKSRWSWFKCCQSSVSHHHLYTHSVTALAGTQWWYTFLLAECNKDLNRQ